jgi:hypothetical protein
MQPDPGVKGMLGWIRRTIAEPATQGKAAIRAPPAAAITGVRNVRRALLLTDSDGLGLVLTGGRSPQRRVEAATRAAQCTAHPKFKAPASKRCLPPGSSKTDCRCSQRSRRRSKRVEELPRSKKESTASSGYPDYGRCVLGESVGWRLSKRRCPYGPDKDVFRAVLARNAFMLADRNPLGDGRKIGGWARRIDGGVGPLRFYVRQADSHLSRETRRTIPLFRYCE